MISGRHLGRQLRSLLLILLCSTNALEQQALEQEVVFPPADFSDHVEDIHQYLDALLSEATDKFQQNNLDPVRLPETLKTFRKKVGFLNFQGGLHTYNGELHGLRTLHRSGEVLVTFDSGDTVTLEADLAFDNLNIRTDARIWFGRLGKRFSMGAKVQYLRGSVQMEIPLGSGGRPKVSGLIIRKIGRITLDFKRLGPLNWVLEGLGFVYLNTVKKFLRDRIERVIVEEVNKEITKVKLPAIMRMVEQ